MWRDLREHLILFAIVLLYVLLLFLVAGRVG